MKRLILIPLILGILAAPIISGQDVPDWSVETDGEVYFIGESMNISITGLYEKHYSLDLVNTTDWWHIHITTRMIGPSGTDKFTLLLHDEWAIGGEYLINISVNGTLMDTQNITIVYDESRLLIYYKKYLVDTGEYMERWIKRADEHIDEQNKKIDNLTFTLFIFSLLIILLCFLSFKLRKIIRENGMKPRIEIIKYNPYETVFNMCILGLTICSITLYSKHEDSIYLLLLIPAFILTAFYIRWYRKKVGAKP